MSLPTIKPPFVSRKLFDADKRERQKLFGSLFEKAYDLDFLMPEKFHTNLTETFRLKKIN